MEQADGHYDRGGYATMTAALEQGESLVQEVNEQQPVDAPEEEATSDRTTSPPPLENSDEEVNGSWLSGQLGGVEREED